MARSMGVRTRRMRMAVLQLFFRGIAHFLHGHIEIQCLAGHRMVEVDVDRAHAHLVHRHRALAAFFEREHRHHARLEAIALLEILLRHALDLTFLALALTFGRRDLHLQRVACAVFFQRFFQPRDQLAMAEQNPQRLPTFVRAFHLLAVHGKRVVERDDLVLASLHCLSLG